MAMFPEKQEKLSNELQEVFDSTEQEVTDDHLSKLNYLQMVIKEALRICPAVPLVAKGLSEPMEIGGYTINPGCTIVVPIMQIHRNKKLWGEDADQFIPERFEPERFSKVHPYAYIPFSQGNRKCMGRKYGMKAMTVILSHFFRNYKVTTSRKYDEMEFELRVILKISNGYMVKIEPRSQSM